MSEQNKHLIELRHEAQLERELKENLQSKLEISQLQHEKEKSAKQIFEAQSAKLYQQLKQLSEEHMSCKESIAGLTVEKAHLSKHLGDLKVEVADKTGKLDVLENEHNTKSLKLDEVQ